MATSFGSIKFRLDSISPLLMHSAQCVNPRHPLNKERDKLGTKKTEEYYAGMALYDFRSALYIDDTGPYIPSDNILASLRDGARISRKGKDVESGVFMDMDRSPLIYKGPRDADGLFSNVNFVDSRPVVINKNKVIRFRPVFKQWALEVEFKFMTDVINKDQIEHYLCDAGLKKGIGDFRPRYGRFSVTRIK